MTAVLDPPATTVRSAAVSYYRDLSSLSFQAGTLTLRRWRKVARGDLSRSWLSMLPDAAAVLVGAQTVAAELADPYLSAVLGDGGAGQQVNVEAFAGMTPESMPVESLLYLPAIDAKQRIATGASPGAAVRLAEKSLAMYVRSTIADAGRLSTAAGMASRRHASGFYRMLRPPSCARCAILAGKFFRWNQGFARHPHCDCVHIPTAEADDSLLFDARQAIDAGQVTGLTAGQVDAIHLGANPAQVVNARRGMYVAGGRTFTTEATTRQGVAGARILARDIDRALGRNVATKTYENYAFDRLKALEYARQFRRGKTYTRLTKSGRPQVYAYRYTRTPRPTAEQLVADATSRDEAIRLLTNFGYIL